MKTRTALFASTVAVAVAAAACGETDASSSNATGAHVDHERGLEVRGRHA